MKATPEVPKTEAKNAKLVLKEEYKNLEKITFSDGKVFRFTDEFTLEDLEKYPTLLAYLD